MAIEVIREGDQVPPRYFLKCDLCHSVLRFTKNDVRKRQDLEVKEDEDDAPVITVCYSNCLECPMCGNENLLPNSWHKWPTSEEELDK